MKTKILCRNFEKSFLEQEKNGLKKDLLELPPHDFFHDITNKLSYTALFFSFKFGINPLVPKGSPFDE